MAVFNVEVSNSSD